MVIGKIKKTAVAVLIGLSLTVQAEGQEQFDNAVKQGRQILGQDYLDQITQQQGEYSALEKGKEVLGAGFINDLINSQKENIKSTLNISDDKIIEPENNELRYKILISDEMGDDRLKSLFNSFAGRNDVSFVLRGLLPEEKTINDVSSRIINLIKEFDVLPHILLDPRPFEAVGAKVAPMIIAYQGDNIINYATGLTNPNYLEESFEKGDTGDLGSFGKTVEITERDIIEVIKERADKLDSKKLIAQAKDNYWIKTKFLTLPDVTETQTRYFAPVITVNNDILSKEGAVIVQGGTQINTLEKMPFTMRLVIFDATNPAQMKFVESLPESSLRTKYITTEFDRKLKWDAIKDVERKLHAPVYQLNRDILTSFDLRAVPSVITADNDANVFVINEYSMEEGAGNE